MKATVGAGSRALVMAVSPSCLTKSPPFPADSMPTLTDEGDISSVWVLDVCGYAWATNRNWSSSGCGWIGVVRRRSGRVGRPRTPQCCRSAADHHGAGQQPEMLRWLELRRVGRQEQQVDVLGDVKPEAGVPAGAALGPARSAWWDWRRPLGRSTNASPPYSDQTATNSTKVRTEAAKCA